MQRILLPGQTYWRREEVHAAGLLVDGRDYYRALWHAAQRARRYIALAGWQFDSDVALLRGDDVGEARGEVRLLPMLDELCRAISDRISAASARTFAGSPTSVRIAQIRSATFLCAAGSPVSGRARHSAICSHVHASRR